jgi:predicted acyl esterase
MLVFAATAGTAHAANGETIQGYVPMSDGVTLAYQVVLPDPAVYGDGPYPTLFDYSGYGPGRTVNYNLDERFGSLGYAIAGVNIRGTGCSGGKFDYFEERQSVDGAEAIEWLADQDWSDGRIAMVNKSYPGITQLFVAAQRPEHLVAIAPGHVFGDLYRDVPFPGGIMNETFAGGWSLAVQPTGSYPQALQGTAGGDQECAANQAEHGENARYNPFVQAFEHLYDDDLFRARSPYEFVDKINVPTLLVESWQDEQVGSRAANLAERFSPDTAWRLLASNGTHGEYYTAPAQREITRFFAHYIPSQGNPAPAGETKAEYEAEPPVIVQWEKQTTNGDEPRFTTLHDQFPPSDHEVKRFFLGQGGTLGDAPSGESTSYTYLPYAGTHNQIWTNEAPAGTTAAFTSEPLAEDLAVLGSGSVDLELSSTAPDTDLEVMLTEVRPDGQEVYVQRGWLRASHRKLDPERTTETRPYQTHRQEDVELLTPGSPASMRVELFPMGHVFRAGSKLRIWVEAPAAISGLWGFLALPAPAQNTIFHSAAQPSSLALPVAPGVDAPGQPECGSVTSQPCRTDPLG